MDEWKPISEATKVKMDERGEPYPFGPMLILASEFAHIAVGYWRQDPGEESGWYSPHDHKRINYWNSFTHWLPIPDLPKDQARRGGKLIAALDAIDHGSVEDCFLQSPLFAKAADALRASAEREKEMVDALESYACDCAPDSCEAGTIGDTICGGRARAVIEKHKGKA